MDGHLDNDALQAIACVQVLDGHVQTGTMRERVAFQELHGRARHVRVGHVSDMDAVDVVTLMGWCGSPKSGKVAMGSRRKPRGRKRACMVGTWNVVAPH